MKYIFTITESAENPELKGFAFFHLEIYEVESNTRICLEGPDVDAGGRLEALENLFVKAAQSIFHHALSKPPLSSENVRCR